MSSRARGVERKSPNADTSTKVPYLPYLIYLSD